MNVITSNVFKLYTTLCVNSADEKKDNTPEPKAHKMSL